MTPEVFSLLVRELEAMELISGRYWFAPEVFAVIDRYRTVSHMATNHATSSAYVSVVDLPVVDLSNVSAR